MASRPGGDATETFSYQEEASAGAGALTSHLLSRCYSTAVLWSVLFSIRLLVMQRPLISPDLRSVFSSAPGNTVCGGKVKCDAVGKGKTIQNRGKIFIYFDFFLLLFALTIGIHLLL